MAHTKATVAKLLKKQRTITKRGLSQQYENTTATRSFYNGDMMTYQDRIQFEDPSGRRRRATVNFNKVQAPVDTLVGFMAQNRRQSKYVARVNSQQGQQLYSKNMNALYSYHRENMNADQIETDQDADMMINGYGAIETDLSYIMGNSTTDPNGEIIGMKLDPLTVGWDPSAKGKNLLDSNWAYYYQDYELNDALKLFQGSDEEDFEQVSDEDPSDTGYVFNPWGGLYDKIKMEDSVEWASKEENMVRVYNHQWMEYETFYRAENPLYTVTDPMDALYVKMRLDVIAQEMKYNGPEGMETGDLFDFDPLAEELTMNEQQKVMFVKEFGKMFKPKAFTRKCYYTAVCSGDHVFTFFKNVCQQGFTIKFKTGVYNDTGMFWIGMVNSMMEPTKYYNKAITEFIFTVASLSKGGVMVEEGAVEDISDFETKWAKTDAVIKVASGAISGSKILQKQQPILPTGIDTIITLSDAAISSNGVDPGFMGDLNDKEQSGILYKRRIRQVISKFARYFDSITLYQKEHARLCADLIRVWLENNNGQWVRLTGTNGMDEFVQISQEMVAAEYDVSIEEAPQTPEDKQETGQGLQMLGDKVALVDPNKAMAIWAESLNYYPIDGEVRNRLVGLLQPQNQETVPLAQYQQLEQLVQQLQSEAQQAQIAKVQSETQKNMAATQKLVVDVSQTQALTAKTLEEAANTGLENDIIRSGGYSEAKVSI